MAGVEIVGADTLQDITNLNKLKAAGGAKGLLKALGSDVMKGLSSTNVAANRAAYGENRFPEKPTKSFITHLVETFDDETLKILLFSAVFTVAFGLYTGNSADTYQGFAIIFTAVIVSGVNSSQNWSKAREFKSLKKMRDERNVTVMRDGAKCTISIHDVVAGDILVLAAGSNGQDYVPCDGIVLQSINLGVDQSSVTGEADLASKTAYGSSDGVSGEGADWHSVSMVAGTMVKEGEGRMLAIAVGERSSLGATIKNMEEEEETDNHLQQRLDELAGQIGKFGTAVGALTFFVLLVLFIWGLGQEGKLSAAWSSIQSTGFAATLLPGGSHYSLILDLIGALSRFFIVGVTIVVVAVPEGLPLAVTLSLAFSMRRMRKDKNFVRRLDACETMGSATVIASDKTGTLTENRMTAQEAWIAGRSVSNLTATGAALAGLTPGLLSGLCRNLSLNSDAEVNTDGDRVSVVGNPSEGALLLMTMSLGESYRSFVNQRSNILAKRLFRKEDKFMSSLYPASSSRSSSDDNSGPILYIKGAPEIVLAKCTMELEPSGDTKLISAARRAILLDEIRAMARKGLRVLGIAERHIPRSVSAGSGKPSWQPMLDSGVLEREATLVALVGIQDPLREGVAEAVDQVKNAGLRVIMVTGDLMETAEAIALSAHILTDQDMMHAKQAGADVVMEGEQFREQYAKPAMEELAAEEEEEAKAKAEGRESVSVGRVARERLQKVVRYLAVLARSSPFDKRDLVKALQWNDEVVAVTGDGTNDALALKAADVGLSMGISGTEMAKEASDIVILDDRFASIVASVRWGRSIKENIRKFLTFQLTINMVALALTLITACMNGGSTDKFPLKPVQLLWVNLIMDSFAALALATEPPSESLMNHLPGGKSERLITRTMWKNMIGHAIFQTILLLWLTLSDDGAQLFGISECGTVKHYTVVFTTFVALQIFNMFNCRAVHDEWNVLADYQGSVIGQAIFGIIIVCQFLIVQFGGTIMQTEPLEAWQWGYCVAIGFVSVPVGFLLKLIPAVESEIETLRGSGEPEASTVARAPLAGEGSKMVSGVMRAAIHEASENAGVASDAAAAEADARSARSGHAAIGRSSSVNHPSSLDQLTASKGGRSARQRKASTAESYSAEGAGAGARARSSSRGRRRDE